MNKEGESFVLLTAVCKGSRRRCDFKRKQTKPHENCRHTHLLLTTFAETRPLPGSQEPRGALAWALCSSLKVASCANVESWEMLTSLVLKMKKPRLWKETQCVQDHMAFSSRARATRGPPDSWSKWAACSWALAGWSPVCLLFPVFTFLPSSRGRPQVRLQLAWPRGRRPRLSQVPSSCPGAHFQWSREGFLPHHFSHQLFV